MTGCADSGTITIKLMMIKCKTDSAEILALTKKSVNEFIKAAERSNLIAIKDGHNTIRCKLIPEEATDIECTGGIYLSFKVDSNIESIGINPGLDTSTRIEHWKVIGPSKCKNSLIFVTRYLLWMDEMGTHQQNVQFVTSFKTSGRKKEEKEMI